MSNITYTVFAGNGEPYRINNSWESRFFQVEKWFQDFYSLWDESEHARKTEECKEVYEWNPYPDDKAKRGVLPRKELNYELELPHILFES